MIKLADWSDKEWAEYLKVSERTARHYFGKGIIHGAYKNSRGEWRAAGNGLNKYLTYQNMAHHSGWKLDEDGDYIDPNLSKELGEAFKPLFNSRKETVMREARAVRLASALTRAMKRLPLEGNQLDAFEEASRWKLSSPTPTKLPDELANYLPTKSSTKIIKGLFDNGLLEYAELLVAMVSAINLDGKAISNQLPSAYVEWVKIRGQRPTGEFIKENDFLRIETKLNKSSYRRFKQLTKKYGRLKLLNEAKRLHPDSSDVCEQFEAKSCHEGAADWRIQPYKAIES